MTSTNIIQSLLEFVSGVDKVPYWENLYDVMQKADTPYKRPIMEWEVDKGVDALKDLRHSEISQSRAYANDSQREFDKNRLSAAAEGIKAEIKDVLRAKGVLVANSYPMNGSSWSEPMH